MTSSFFQNERYTSSYTEEQRAKFYLTVLDKLIQKKIRNEFNDKRTLTWLYEKIDTIISELDRITLDKDKDTISYLVIYLVLKIYDIIKHFSYFISKDPYGYIDVRLKKLQEYYKDFSTGVYIVLEKDVTPIANIVENISNSKSDKNILLLYIVYDMLEFINKIFTEQGKQYSNNNELENKKEEYKNMVHIRTETDIKERLKYLEKYISVLELTTKILSSQNKILLRSIHNIEKTNIRKISEKFNATFTFILYSSLVLSILLCYDMFIYNIPLLVIIYSIIYIILIIYLWYVTNSAYNSVTKIKNIISNLEKFFIDNLEKTISEKINKVK